MHRYIVAAVVAALLIVSAVAAVADNDEVIMGGYLLFRLRCPAGGFTAQERIDQIQLRVDKLLSLDPPQNPVQTKVVKQGQAASLYAAGLLVITVQPCDARSNGTTPVGLANTWARRIRSIYPLAIPKQPGPAAPGSIKYPRVPR